MADTLLQEVDADVRAEKLAQQWQQWKKPLAVFCVALVLGTAAGQVWQHMREARGAKWFAALSAAQQQLPQQPDKAAEAFAQVAASASGDAQVIAQLWFGKASFMAGKTVDAVAAYKAASESKPSIWSDLGCLRLASLDAVAASGCLAANSESPLRTRRQLWAAALDAEQQKSPEAIARLEALAADKSATDAERAEAAQWAAALKASK